MEQAELEMKKLVAMMVSPDFITKWTPFYSKLIPKNRRNGWLSKRIMRIVKTKPELYPMLLEVSKDEEKWILFMKELEKTQLKKGD
jgi:hypothetical protein